MSLEMDVLDLYEPRCLYALIFSYMKDSLYILSFTLSIMKSNRLL